MHNFKSLKIAAMILIFSLLETTLFADITFFGAKIELLLMLAIFLGLFYFRKFAKQVYLAAFFCGAAKDILSALPLGVNIIVFISTAFLVGKISRHIFVPNKLFFGGLVFSGILIQGFICAFLSREILPTGFPWIIIKMVLPSAVISTLSSPLAFSFFKLALSENENT